MLWYKDKKKFQWQKLFEAIVLFFAILCILFTIGYFSVHLEKSWTSQNCVTRPAKSTILHI